MASRGKNIGPMLPIVDPRKIRALIAAMKHVSDGWRMDEDEMSLGRRGLPAKAKSRQRATQKIKIKYRRSRQIR